MSALPSTTTGPDRDERLARLLLELSERAGRGEAADVEEVARDHPDLAVELRELWAAAQFAEEFARPRTLARRTTIPPNAPAGRGADATPCADPGLAGRSFGDFDLLEEIGRGGMGVVYKAWQKSLGRVVALKTILRGEQATPADVARFQVEAEALAHLDHPNIVPIYGASDTDGQAWFSMRYVEGQTLTALLSRGPLRAGDAARLLAAIARAVDFAHGRGILHRDLKPSNILLDREGRPHVTDFGLAKRVQTQESPVATAPGGAAWTTLTHSGGIVGTPAYMAPEQVSGSRGTPSPASDVYSLGVILYEMLTGRPPFQAPTPVDTLLMVLDQDPVRPGMLNPKVDPDLELICLKCIQKEPELRYASAAQLAADLEAYLAGEQLSIRETRLADVGQLFARMFRETHHAVVLENWGVLWMCHSLKIFLQCVITAVMAWLGVRNPLWYLLLWGGGLMVWGAIFWRLRKRAGPVLFVERQVAHVWAAAILATISVFILEMLLKQPVLKLAPMLAVIAGITFVVKAGMLTGAFYVQAASQFLITIPMALFAAAGFPEYGILLFGVVTAVGFFIPGLHYCRQRLRTLQAQRDMLAEGEQ
jgi:serine/threonine-protein kinase